MQVATRKIILYFLGTKAVYKFLSLFSAFLFTLIIVVAQKYSNNQSERVLEILNLLLILISITNASSGQILQKYLASREVFSKLLIGLSFFIIIGLLGFALISANRITGMIVVCASLVNIIELYNVEAVYSMRQIQGALISLSARLTITLGLITIMVSSVSPVGALIVINLLLAVIALVLSRISKPISNQHSLSYNWTDLGKDIFRFNLVNWPVALSQNIVRIFFYNRFGLSEKIYFEYLSKYISLLVMLFDYDIRYEISRLTKIILDRSVNIGFKYYFGRFKIYGLFIFAGVILFSGLIKNIDLFLIGTFVMLFNLFSFLVYARLIRQERSYSLIWALIIYSSGASANVLGSTASILVSVVILILAISTRLSFRFINIKYA